MSITAALVKELRERTGAGMMECKNALVEANGDIDLGADILRKKNITKVDKKAGRTTAEGTITVLADTQSGVMAEINCETDFVARGDAFKQFAKEVGERALSGKMQSLAELQAAFEARRADLISEVGENITIRRFASKTQTGEGVVGTYAHGDANGVRIGVLVALKKGTPALAKEVAMHVAAMNPEYLTARDIPAERMAKEKEIFTEQTREEKKPAEVIQKMIEGKLKKFATEVSLVEQAYVKDPSKTIETFLKESGGEIDSFVRFAVGEGVEKKEDNFVAEVMAQVKG